MTIQAIGATTSLGATPSPAQTASSGSAAERTDPDKSTIVISRVTVTNSDGSTTTTITYADGHTETETTPPKAGTATAEAGKVTAVNILV